MRATALDLRRKLKEILEAIDRGETVTILATHPLPPRRPSAWRLRNEQLEAIAAARDEFGDRLIIVGDFNASPFSPCLRHFVSTMRRSGLALRYASKGHGIKPTWPTFNRLMFTPLDHIFVTDNLVVTEFRTGPHIGSDHLPIQATITLGRARRSSMQDCRGKRSALTRIVVLDKNTSRSP